MFIYNRARHDRGDTSAESSLSRGTASQSSSLRSKSSSLSKRHASRKMPPPMEGDVFESSVYQAPGDAVSTHDSVPRHSGSKPAVACSHNDAINIISTAITEENSPVTSSQNTASSSEMLVNKELGGCEQLEKSDVQTVYTHPSNVYGHKHTVTLSGTIKRGLKQDQVNVTLSANEIAALNKYTARDQKQEEAESKCSAKSGPHVVLFSLLYAPLAFICSLFLSFYTGSMCWYNIYIFLSEECSIFHKIFLCPLLIIAYPVYILLTSLLIAFYAMFVQISWYCTKWQREIRDLDKNFYGAMCNIIGLPQCSPYEIIVLDDNAQSVECDDVVNRKI